MDQEAWFEIENAELAARSLVDHVRALSDSDGQERRRRWFACWSRYEGKVFTDESMRGAWDAEVRYNVSRSAVDTAQAEIAARQRPKPMFLTSGASWKVRRKAKRLDRAVESQFHQRQGARYADIWELTEDAFRDAEIDVGGVVKVTIDYAAERLRYDRVPAYEILVDPFDAETGDPQCWYHEYEIAASSARTQFAGTKKTLEAQKIRAKISNSTNTARAVVAGRTTYQTQSVKIYEGWFLPPSADEPGRHIVACSDGVLVDEEWDWPMPPLALVVWSREAFGVWGTGLVQAGATQHDKIQELARNIDERFRLCAHRTTYYKAGTVGTEQMTSNETHTFVPMLDMSQIPVDRDIPPVTGAETSHLTDEIRQYFDMAGVSQMSAAQRKEPGVDSGIAIQTLGDMKAVRFLPRSRAYEMLFVRLGEITARALGDLIKDRKVVARWPGAKTLEEVDINDAWLEDNLYQVRVAPVSAMSRDPAQRLQIVEQLAGLGFLPKEKYFELLGMPDLDGVLEQETSEQRWVEKLIDRYLDAADDKDLKKRGGYVEPDGYLMNAIGALALVGQHYFDAMTNDAPEYNAKLMRRFMSSLRRILEKQQAAKAEAQKATQPMAVGSGAGVAPVAAGQTAMPQAA